MDKQLRAEAVAMFERVARDAYEVYNERWLKDDELCEHISILTKRWLRDNGDMLPRSQFIWTDENGNEHKSSFMYPLHKIQAMIADGRIKTLRKVI